MSNILKGMLGLIFVLFMVFVGSRLIGYFITGWQASKASTADIVGLKITKETYTSSCVAYAMADKTGEPITKEFATSYCGCVYELGVQQMGYDKFIEADKELTRTNIVTPEINTIVNKCAQEAITGETI